MDASIQSYILWISSLKALNEGSNRLQASTTTKPGEKLRLIAIVRT